MSRPAPAGALPTVLAAAVLIGGCACGRDDGGIGTRTGGPSADGPSPGPTVTVTVPTGPPQACGADRVGPDQPSVSLQRPHEVARTELTGSVPFPCASRIWVDAGGAAGFAFGRDGACQLTQNVAAKPATAVAREPDGTMLRLDQGVATCTLAKPIMVCAPGSVLPTSQYIQASVTCDPDPDFRVAVFAGTATITTPSGSTFEMGPGQELRCNPTSCVDVKPSFEAKFSRADRQVFAVHNRVLQLSPDAFAPRAAQPTG